MKKIDKIISVVVFVLLISVLPIMTIISTPKEKHVFSEMENRYLTSFPEISKDKIFDKTFMTEFEKWVSDIFVFRTDWINIKNQTERITGKTEINNIFTYDGRMIQKWDSFDEDNVKKNLDAMRDFADRHETETFFLLAPTAQEIYLDTLPANAPVLSEQSFILSCYDNLQGITGIDVTSVLSANREGYIYYRTDHHWTSLGAYLAYQSAGEKMGYTPTDIGKYNIEHASSDFRGTLFSKTLDKNVTPDVIDFYTHSGDDPFLKLEIFDGTGFTEYNSLFFREYLDVKDKYAAFLGQNSPIMRITSDLSSERKLLIFKDSYAHCYIPFLVGNYSEICVLDMRYINTDYHEFVNPDEFDEVLFLYNVITFSEDTNLRKLNMGK